MKCASVRNLKLLSTHCCHLTSEVPLIQLLRMNIYIFSSCIGGIGDIPQAPRSLTAHLLEVLLHDL